MKRKKHLILLICTILLLGIIAVFNLLSPRPIVEDVSISRVIRVQYNPYFNQEMDARIEFTDYDEEEILDCLSRYTEYRMINSVARGNWIGDIELEVTIDTGDGFKNILMGNDNYSYESYGKPKYKIREADTLKSELLDLMDIQK